MAAADGDRGAFVIRMMAAAAMASSGCTTTPAVSDLDEHCAQVYLDFAEQMARDALPGAAIHNIKLGDECADFTGPTFPDESSVREEAE